MAQQKKDPAAQAAVKSAMQELVRMAGNQKRASELYGIPQSKISDVLNKDRMPRADTLIIMRRVLGRSIDDILGLTPIDLAGRVAALERRFGRPEDRAEMDRAKAATSPIVPAPTHAQTKSRKGSDR